MRGANVRGVNVRGGNVRGVNVRFVSGFLQILFFPFLDLDLAAIAMVNVKDEETYSPIELLHIACYDMSTEVEKQVEINRKLAAEKEESVQTIFQTIFQTARQAIFQTRPLAFRERCTTIFPTEFSASAYFPMAGLEDFLSQVCFVFLECGPEMDPEIFDSVVR